MTPHFRSAALFAAALTVTAAAAPVKIELPTETPLFKAGPGSELVTAQCLTCHSSEYITIQPPFARPAWKASVEKMQKKFGAPIPPEQVDALVDYIVKNYGTEAADSLGKKPTGGTTPTR